ncbi:unnamed protein product [Durusdinium trenchii]|uniref:Uncharacterized protein n=1 Tax=Durusdinium trenchii TaxID=1381693 RepID=A0ABP0SXU8_9DINO
MLVSHCTHYVARGAGNYVYGACWGLLGSLKWHGGVYCPQDQSIYGIPCNAECVLKISKGSVTTFAHDSPVLKGRCKWYGGLLGCDGCIYGIPNCAPSVLKIDPHSQEVINIGPTFSQGGQKWHGGVVGKDGCIYGIPSHADAVLKIEPSTGSVRTIGQPIESGTLDIFGLVNGGRRSVGQRFEIWCAALSLEWLRNIYKHRSQIIKPELFGLL